MFETFIVIIAVIYILKKNNKKNALNSIKTDNTECDIANAKISESYLDIKNKISKTEAAYNKFMDGVKNYLKYSLDTNYSILEENDKEAVNAYIKGKAEGIVFFVAQTLDKIPFKGKFYDDFDYENLLDDEEENSNGSLEFINNDEFFTDEEFCSNANLRYDDETKELILDYPLHNISLLKRIPLNINIENGKIKKTYYSDETIKKFYESLVYQRIFAAINALYSGDIKNHIQNIIINGCVNKKSIHYIISLKISRNQFDKLNFKTMDRKQCINELNGIISPDFEQAIEITPIKKATNFTNDCLENTLQNMGYKETQDIIQNYLNKSIEIDYNFYKNNKEVIDYEQGIVDGIVTYFQKILSKLPPIYILDNYDIFHDNNNITNYRITHDKNASNVDIEYNSENKILLVNYPLPDFEQISKLPKDIKYIASTGKNKTTYYPENVLKKMYDSLIYQIIFSVINAIFKNDKKQHVDSIVINGYLDTIDRSYGKQVVICISSLHINRKEFEELNLSQIDPKQCFKRLKGVAGIQMDTQTPVAPIIQINKEDKRFVEAYDVAKNIDTGTNLAAMDWKDFENLIRELFEWKFSSNGGECKITQASRDGGVDAIAFDPDPILGGKIIIQAKRYTNVVGVSAVRDLYGTLINEGASKGILITTSDYGSDAHKFAKGKPITLLNGNNLLHLLNEMGTKAYINIKEAKKLLKEENK